MSLSLAAVRYILHFMSCNKGGFCQTRTRVPIDSDTKKKTLIGFN